MTTVNFDRSAVYEGPCISAAEFAGEEPTFTIREFARVVIEEEDGRLREKGAVFFHDHSAGWLLNLTNTICLEAMFGADTAKWAGKRVTLTAAVVPFGETFRLGVRIKGSPHLDDYLDVYLQLPKQDPFFMRLVPTRVSWMRGRAA